jgi:predicted HTH transcriptional regulator
VASGEGPTIEFKIQLPSTPAARVKVARTVAAFSNGAGGTVVFGINDDGTPAPLGENQARGALDSVANWVRDLVAPVPGFDVTAEAAPGGDGFVVALSVDAGATPPYGVEPAHPRYYIRRGATTFDATADQVRALARSDINDGAAWMFMR